MGLEDAGRLVGVSRETVRRWRKGDRSEPRDSTLEALDAYVTHGSVAKAEGEESGAPGFFRTLNDSLAHFRGIAPPGTAQARKKLAWESQTDAAKHFGWDLPNDWYEIPRMIDEGEV